MPTPPPELESIFGGGVGLKLEKSGVDQVLCQMV